MSERQPSGNLPLWMVVVLVAIACALRWLTTPS